MSHNMATLHGRQGFTINAFEFRENFMRHIAGFARPAARLVIALAAFASAAVFAQIVDRPVPGDPVRIDSGRVAGKVLPSGVKAYFGIPYVAAPVRELRWRDPQPVKPWQGILNADRFGPECIQVLRRKNLNHYFGEEATSEDCLFLNVWAAPTAHAGARLPVVVFIHGGGFTLGSSGMALYGGENVARAGAVFVNFNYRVGAMGFMAHPELDAESPHHTSGDYGFLDIVAALQWIQRNIERFGGDPHNVTVTGQSAGSAAVSALAASPLAKGLFQRGMGMSLSLFDNRLALMNNAQGEQTGLAIQNAMGVKSVAELRLLPADRILALQKDCQLDCGTGGVAVGPTIDGYFLPDTVEAIFAAGKQNDVPMISGFTRDESSNSLRAAANQAAYIAEARRLYGEQADRFLQLYPAADDAQARAMSLAAARESQAELGHWNWARAHVATGKAPYYMYMFSRVHPFADGVTFYDNVRAVGAYHTSDVPYWFQTQDTFDMYRKTRDWTAYDRELSTRMMGSLLAFARTGNPSTAATPWPAWTADDPRYMEFGDTVQVLTESVPRLQFNSTVRPTAAAAASAPVKPKESRD
jgi:para-nitrobenzyl esterase